MNDVVRLHTLKDKCSQEVIDILKEILSQAEAGEVIGITAIAEKPDGRYCYHGSSTMSRLQTSGALLEAAIKRLGFPDESE